MILIFLKDIAAILFVLIAFWLLLSKIKYKLFFVIAFLLRSGLVFIDTYLMALPESGKDAMYFYNSSFNAYSEFFADIPIHDAVLAIVNLQTDPAIKLYLFFHASFGGVSILFLKMVSLFFGLLSVYYIYNSVRLISGDSKKAILAGYLAALAPSFALYSVLTLRESVIHMFLAMCVYLYVKFISTRHAQYYVFSIGAGFLAAAFHGALIIFVFFVLVLGLMKIRTFGFLLNPQASTNLHDLRQIFFIFFLLALIFSIDVHKFDLKEIFLMREGVFDHFVSLSQKYQTGNLKFPDVFVANTFFEALLLLPIRFAFFILGPVGIYFSFEGLLLVLDGLVWLYLFNGIDYRQLRKNNELFMLFISAILLLIAFSFAVNNFGTGFRHKAKILPLIIIFAISFKKIYSVKAHDK